MQIQDDAAGDAVKRLRRIEGRQIPRRDRMLEAGRDCADLVTQLAVASRALDKSGFKIIASGLEQCLSGDGGEQAADLTKMEELSLFLT
jgi:DNA-binding FrmR family transcriptional regulator